MDESFPQLLEEGSHLPFQDRSPLILLSEANAFERSPGNQGAMAEPLLVPLGFVEVANDEQFTHGIETSLSPAKDIALSSSGLDSLTGLAGDGLLSNSLSEAQSFVSPLPATHQATALTPVAGDLFIVPGAREELTQLRFQWSSRHAGFNNEVGVFVLDAQGRVNGVAPGEAGFALAAITSSSRQIIFAYGEQAGAWKELAFQGGDRLAFYLIQNSSTAQWLSQNPNNLGGNGPIAFFSVDGVNPDGFDHAQSHILQPGVQRFSWEDRTGGGDRDFNDVVFVVSEAGLKIPGSLGQVAPLTVNWISKEASFKNEMGYFVVDDAQGRIGSLLPGDVGYAAAVLDKSRSQVLFAQGQSPGVGGQYSLPSNKYLGWYLIQNATTEAFLSQNPGNLIGSGPVAFFSYPGANPDGVSHVHYRDGNEMVWEDQTGGGDRDYNDLVFRFELGEPTRPTARPKISVGDVVVGEGGTAQLIVSLSEASDKEITVAYATADGSAMAAEDYTAISGTVAFAAGETKKTISISVLDDDRDEEDEQFFLQLDAATQADIAVNEAIITIEDNNIANQSPSIISTPVETITIADTGGKKIIVANDEWALSERGFAEAPEDAKQFVSNVAKFFTGGSPGKFLGYSTNFSLAGAALAEAFAANGHEWAVTRDISFNLETLLQYDGIFVGGSSADNPVLIEYVKSGGNVYLFGGTGNGGELGKGPYTEALAWQSFLEEFGLALDGTSFDRIEGRIPFTDSFHPIFEGVQQLYQDNAQAVIDLDPTDSKGVIVASSTTDKGRYAIFDGNPNSTLNAKYIYDVNAVDPDEDVLTYSLITAPEGMTIDSVSGLIEWNPTGAIPSQIPVAVRADDGRGGFDIQEYAIQVSDTLLGEIQGMKFNDRNGDGIFQGSEVKFLKPIQPYQSFQDSPFNGLDFSEFYLENFEDLELNTPGVSAEPARDLGIPIKLGAYNSANPLFAFIIDSVDADDGSIDGNGSTGASFLDGFNSVGASAQGVRFNFDEDELGFLPTHVGIVWTENTSDDTIRFEAFDAQGSSLGVIEVPTIFDGNFSGNTNEDLFFGVTYADGISAIAGHGLRENANAFEVDHLQYGINNQSATAIEKGLAGVAVYLDLNNNNILDIDEPRQITASDNPNTEDIDETGQYRFTSLLPGNYIVREVVPQGYVQTLPVSNSNLILNGSFEEGINPGSSFLSINPGSTNITGWTVTRDQIDYVGGLWGGSNGNRSIDLDGTPGFGGIAQTFETIPDQKYLITFDLSGNPGAQPTIKQLEVTAANQSTIFSFDITGRQVSDMGWRTESFEFVAAENETTLEFRSLNASGGIGGPAIDNVSVKSLTSGFYNINLGAGEIVEGINFGNQSIVENTNPSFSSSAPTIARAEQLLRYEAVAEDSDNDVLAFDLTVKPDGMTVDSATGVVLWQPSLEQVGQVFDVTLRVQDGQNGIAEQSFQISVVASGNTAPTITSTPLGSSTIIAGAQFEYDVEATDADGDSLTYALKDPLTGMVIEPETGLIRWTPTPEQQGAIPIQISVSDPFSGEATQEFTLTVLVDQIAPEVTLLLGKEIGNVGESVVVQVLATDNIGVQSRTLLVNDVPVILDAEGRATVPLTQIGPISLVATAVDTAGNIGTSIGQVFVRDPNDTEAPIVELSPLINGSVFTAPGDLIGTASDANLLYYSLSIAPITGGEFTEILRGTNSVFDNVLGEFDPTLLQNDAYILQLFAIDQGGLTASTTTEVNIAGDLKLGNFQLSFTDLSIPVSGIPIQVTRTYDTLTSNTRDDFGYGWRMEFRDTDLRTSLAPTGAEEFGNYAPFKEGTRVYITAPGGRREGFTFQAQRARGPLVSYRPAFVADPGVTSTLSVGNMDLRRVGNEYFVSNSSLPFNPADSGVNFSGQYTLTSKEGIVYQIDAETGDLNTITDRSNNTLTFTDSSITSSTGQQVTFERDAQSRITGVIDPEGNRISYAYDALGDLISVTDREGNTTRFDYNDDRAHYLEEIIDPLGRSGVRSEYDDQGRLKRMIDADGNPVELIYDPDNDIQQVRDQLGNVTTYEYDQRGNVVSEVDARGGITRRTYDGDNNMLTETDPLGNTTAFTYDANENVLTETDALGNVTRYTYDANGNVLTTTDPTGQTTTNTYDVRGNLTQIAGQASGPLNLSYDAAGNLTTMQDGSGTTTFVYDAFGNITRQTDALGTATTFTYDPSSNRTSETTTQTLSDGSTRTLITQMEYDDEGRVIRTINAEGGVTETIYDAVGNRVEEIDALGRSTKYVYDDRGQLIAILYPDTTPTDDRDNPRTRTEYDAKGQVIAEIDEMGRRMVMIYDALGRQIATLYPDATLADDSDNPRTQTVYDAAGRVLAQIDELGNRTEFRYDAAGRVIETILPDETPDDLSDNPRFITAYNAAGRQRSQTDALGQVTQFLYDSLGRPVGQMYADGTRTAVAYDAAGRVSGRTDQVGITTRYEYDAQGRLEAVVDALDQRTMYTYDEQGNLLTHTDAKGNTTRYEYDRLGRRTATVLLLGQRSIDLYDAVGNRVRSTDFNGAIKTYSYDERYRLIAKDLPGTEFDENHTYTLNGQLSTVRDSRGTTTYEYDERDRLLRRTEPDGRIIAYSYDAAGNRTSVEIPSGNITYTFDAQNRLKTVTDPEGSTTTYAYNLVGNLVRTGLPNSTVEIRQYDDLNRLEYIETSGPAGIIASFRYTLDDTGNRTQVVENDGRRVVYDYDDLYRLTAEIIYDPGAVGPSHIIEYTYDAVGNRLSRTDSGEGATLYTYDNNDRLLVSTLNGSTTTYTYDNNGNTTSKTEGGTTITYTWNADNRLMGADTDSNGTIDVTNRYNQNGIRVSQTVNGEETRFLIDENRDYAQVLEEYTPGAIIKVSYVYGNDLISQSREGEKSFYHVDGLESTRALSDEAGLDAAQYVYDAFGQSIAQIGTIKNSYLFAGEQRDRVLNLDYLRQRYLNFTNGRLNSRDDFDGLIQKPITLNKYIYGNSSPITFIDPSGNFSIFSIGASLGLNTVLYGILLGDILLSRSKAIVKNYSNTSPRFLPSAPATEIDLIKEKNGIKSAPGPSSPHGWRREGVGHLGYFHPGAFSAYRRLSANGVSGQQVTYDSDGELITGGEGAGTPDLISSEYSLVNHFFADVVPHQRLGWQEYNSRPEWAPQNERNARENVV